MILLDTCVLLWLVADQKKLSQPAVGAIRRNVDSLFVSAITAFEIAIKHRSGKLKLPVSPAAWFAEALEFHGIREIPVTSDIAVKSVKLPALHNDPGDRIIVATASIQSMKIITSDSLILQYDKSMVIW